MIEGIDRITYGVDDIAACRKFFLDWGLKLVREDGKGLDFESLNGCEVRVRRSDDAAQHGERLLLHAVAALGAVLAARGHARQDDLAADLHRRRPGDGRSCGGHCSGSPAASSALSCASALVRKTRRRRATPISC